MFDDLDNLLPEDFAITNESDSDNINNAPLSTHEAILQELISYSRHNEYFERYSRENAAILACESLEKLSVLIVQRINEIEDRKEFVIAQAKIKKEKFKDAK